MNSIKALEADAGELFKQIGQIEGVDSRLLALAKTNLQQGFMWFVRSIAKPNAKAVGLARKPEAIANDAYAGRNGNVHPGSAGADWRATSGGHCLFCHMESAGLAL